MYMGQDIDMLGGARGPSATSWWKGEPSFVFLGHLNIRF
jgi:hypothetical protein